MKGMSFALFFLCLQTPTA